jgi:hypothetical protein
MVLSTLERGLVHPGSPGTADNLCAATTYEMLEYLGAVFEMIWLVAAGSHTVSIAYPALPS